ncbi:oxidoreductase [Hufsiella ginkgonis]|uniref:Probable oxidoreductase n=1 Tax=Hufsiella ginkgonis TaxID=2695274 RepID=A0A7K1Y2Q0_9SPHI|nr:oxidoreductase [Hufsiella ginkgonis]MXV17257.1 SDR family NAD(P)-dependent oxidoreductase [Hufsiella ginkgonis]
MNGHSSQQHPLQPIFSAAATAAEVIGHINLTGKTAIVTGGYSGIGLETVRALHSAGAAVIVPARDTAKAEKSLAGLNGVAIEPLDLIDAASIDAFTERFLATGSPLHILVNSAGIMANPLTRDADGNESQFATNHLGHFRLVNKLWPALQQANGARVVSVASRGHRFSPMVFDDVNFIHREYDRWKAYGQSKTANVLFAVALDRRGKAENIRAFAVHPGTIADTGLAKHVAQEDLQRMGAIDAKGNAILDASRQMKNAAQGAATGVWCATSPQLAGIGGVYCENCNVSPVVTEEEFESWVSGAMGRLEGVAWYAVDEGNAERLWELSGRIPNFDKTNNR